MGNLKIVKTIRDDLPVIYDLFDRSVIYQEERGFPSWRDYDRDAIVRDIAVGNQYKAVNDKELIGIVFSVAYRDKIIWRHMDDGQSIYLHRIVVNPAFKGQKLFGLIVDWAIQHVKERGLQSVRMDTWAANKNIIEYYKTFGFHVIENFTTPDSEDLPVHNRNLPLTLMEYAGLSEKHLTFKS